MGIRHQFWAIASVGGRYRSLGVVHCQNATGTDAIRACYRLLKIFGSSANEKLIRHDCNCASTKTEDWWKSIAGLSEGKLEDRIAFPFIHTCLFLGAAYDSRDEPDPFFYPVSAYETGISPMNLLWNNQSGFTIIDVTDRNQLRYCFMFPPRPSHMPGVDGEEEEEIADESPRCRPLSAEEYVSCEDACLDGPSVDVDLSQWSLISSDTLRELWPEVPWKTKSNRAPCDQLIGSCCERTTVPTLKELASRQFLQVDSQHIEEALDRAKCIPGLSPRLRQLLYESPDFVKGIALLGAAVEEAKALDLSPFPWLEEETILQLVESNANLQTIESIDLSCNTNISVTTVERLLRLCPNVATLTVVQTPNLPLEALGKVLAAKNEIELYHSDLFRAALEEPRHYRCEQDNTRLTTLPNHMAPAETVGQIIFLSINTDIAKKDPLRLKGGGLKWSELARSSSGVTTSQRRCEFFGTTIPLQDAFLNPSRSGAWFWQLLLFFATNSATNDVRTYRDGHASMGCACALAMNVEDNWRVSPIPPNALIWPRMPKTIGESRRSRALESIKTGEWTLLIAVEDKPPGHWYDRSCNELRYVFLKRDVDKVVRCGVSDFYKHTTGRAPTQEAFPWQIPRFGRYPTERRATVKQCKADEVEEVLGPLMAKLTEDMTRESALPAAQSDEPTVTDGI